jgi:hypothetical protein
VSELLHKCWAKAIVAEGNIAGVALSWTMSRRGYLKIFDDQLRCGGWTIPYRDIEEAILFTGWGIFLPGHVLLVRTRKRSYKFGLNLGRFWKGELPFEVKRGGYRFRRSWTLIAVRIATLAALAYCAWNLL